MERLKQLDGLRLLCFFAVFAFHCNTSVYWFGSYGVACFFVLSGWLITRLLARHQTASPASVIRRFYFRRVLRIFPAYFTVLAIFAVTLGTPWLISFSTYSFNLVLYLQSIGPVPAPLFTHLADHWRSSGIHFWSLCVEEQFYLVYPLLFLSLGRARQAACTAALVLFIAARHWHQHFTPDGYFGILPWVAGEYLAWGCLAALLPAAELFERHGSWIVYSSSAALVLLFTLGPKPLEPTLTAFQPGNWETLYGLCFALLVAGLTYAPTNAIAMVLGTPVCSWLGEKTYGMYLIHLFAWPMTDWLTQEVPRLATLPQGAFRLTLTIALALVSWYVVERPFLRLKDRLKLGASGLAKAQATA